MSPEFGDGLGEGEPLGLGDGETLGLGLGEPVGDTLGLAVGEPVGETVGDGVPPVPPLNTPFKIIVAPILTITVEPAFTVGTG